jgi:hypothetical protein
MLQRHNSARRIIEANLQWDRSNNKDSTLPNLKRYRSDNSSKRIDDSKVRFKTCKRKDSDDSSPLIANKLNFSELSDERERYDSYKGMPACDNRNKNANWKIMNNVDKSLNKEDGCWNKFFGNSDKNKIYQDPLDRKRYDNNIPKVLDLRNIEKETVKKSEYD